jgi:hypothetical protein
MVAPTPTTRYELTYHFEKRNDPSSAVEYPISITSDSNDTTAQKDDAYRHLTRMLGVSSVAEAKRNWEARRTGVAFANPPWSSWDDLECTLGGLTGVQHIRYDPHESTTTIRPRFILRVEAGRANVVLDGVRQYYAGLSPSRNGGREVVFVVSPLV